MKMLHLTDLHLTNPNEDLNTVWLGLKDRLPKYPFDVIVVSGDLTKDANLETYAEVGQFFSESLLPCVRDRQRWRIVIVPGNHDVDWEAKLGDDLPIEELENGSKAEFEAYRENPERAPLRIDGDIRGIRRVIKILPLEYQSRFSNFQRFIEDFYGDCIKPPNQRFKLIVSDHRQHWSAHVFGEERIAICGFNSCHFNDKYWRGAAISEKAIQAASNHLHQHAKGFTWIAVWHHGMTSERGSPDHLTLKDAGLIANAGFHLGIHGHTHEDEHTELFRELGQPLPIIGTGSFGAGPTQRPGGVRNQVSILTVAGNNVERQVFSRHDKTGHWIDSEPAISYTLMRHGKPRTSKSPGTHCQVTWSERDTIRILLDLLAEAHEESAEPILLLDTFFALVPRNLWHQLFVRSINRGIKILFLDPYSELGKWRARRLNVHAEDRVRRAFLHMEEALQSKAFAFGTLGSVEGKSRAEFVAHLGRLRAELSKKYSQVEIGFTDQYSPSKYLWGRVLSMAVPMDKWHNYESVWTHMNPADDEVFERVKESFEELWKSRIEPPISTSETAPEVKGEAKHFETPSPNTGPQALALDAGRDIKRRLRAFKPSRPDSEVVLLVGRCRVGSTPLQYLLSRSSEETTALYQPAKSVLRQWTKPSGFTEVDVLFRSGLSIARRVVIKETLGPRNEQESLLNPLRLLLEAGFDKERFTVIVLTRDPGATFSSWLQFWEREIGRERLFKNFVLTERALQEVEVYCAAELGREPFYASYEEWSDVNSDHLKRLFFQLKLPFRDEILHWGFSNFLDRNSGIVFPERLADFEVEDLHVSGRGLFKHEREPVGWSAQELEELERNRVLSAHQRRRERASES